MILGDVTKSLKMAVNPLTAVTGKGHADLRAKHTEYNEKKKGTPLVVQGLRLHAPTAGTPGSIPGQGTRSHMPQLRVYTPQRRSKIPHAKLGLGTAREMNNF